MWIKCAGMLHVSSALICLQWALRRLQVINRWHIYSRVSQRGVQFTVALLFGRSWSLCGWWWVEMLASSSPPRPRSSPSCSTAARLCSTLPSVWYETLTHLMHLAGTHGVVVEWFIGVMMNRLSLPCWPAKFPTERKPFHTPRKSFEVHICALSGVYFSSDFRSRHICILAEI